MNDLGSVAAGATVRCRWNSNESNGASITRATNGTISVYKDDNVAQSTAGVTDTEDFDALPGVHLVEVDTSADAFYEVGHDYAVVLSAAAINGQTVNAVLGQFSIENRAGLSAADIETVQAAITSLGAAVNAIEAVSDKLAVMIEGDEEQVRPVQFLLYQPPDITIGTSTRNAYPTESWLPELKAAADAAGVRLYYEWGYSKSFDAVHYPDRLRPGGMLDRLMQAAQAAGWGYSWLFVTGYVRVEDLDLISPEMWERMDLAFADSESKTDIDYLPWGLKIPARIGRGLRQTAGWGSVRGLIDVRCQSAMVTWQRMKGALLTPESPWYVLRPDVWATFTAPTNLSATTWLYREYGLPHILGGAQLYNNANTADETEALLRAGVFLSAQQAIPSGMAYDASGWGARHGSGVTPAATVVQACAEVNALGLTADIAPLPATVGILWENECQLYALQTQVFWHTIFLTGRECRMVHWQDDISGLDAVVIPRASRDNVCLIPLQHLAWLEAFVTAGGTVVTESGANLPAWITQLPPTEGHGTWTRVLHGYEDVANHPPETEYETRVWPIVNALCDVLDAEPPTSFNVVIRDVTMRGAQWRWTVDFAAGTQAVEEQGE